MVWPWTPKAHGLEFTTVQGLAFYPTTPLYIVPFLPLCSTRDIAHIFSFGLI